MSPLIDPIAVRQGDRLALTRALTAVENNTPESRNILSALFPHTGKTHLIGVTGAPGTGKSTLVNQLAKSLRHSDNQKSAPSIAIIAVDPTSPFTGGALLGDRIRMQDLSGDKDIFIRSMASRGSLGGLAHQTAAFATILDGAGFDLVIIETVGAGQAEVNIAQLAHTVIVVEAPGLGDDIQAIKAGILEIADILVVNKADRAGSENTARALQAMIETANSSENRFSSAGKHGHGMLQASSTTEPVNIAGWKPPVLKITATEGKGIEALIHQIENHKIFLQNSGLWQVKEANRLRQDLEALINDSLVQNWQKNLDKEKFEKILTDVIQKKYTPTEAAEMLVYRSNTE